MRLPLLYVLAIFAADPGLAADSGIDACAQPVALYFSALPGQPFAQAEAISCGSGSEQRLLEHLESSSDQPDALRSKPSFRLRHEKGRTVLRLVLHEGGRENTYEADPLRIHTSASDEARDAQKLVRRSGGGSAQPMVAAVKLAEPYVALDVTDVSTRQLAKDLARIKQIDLKHIDYIGAANTITVQEPVVKLRAVLEQIAAESGVLVQSVDGNGYAFRKIANGTEILALRLKASQLHTGTDDDALRPLLERIVTLAKPGSADEAQAEIDLELMLLGDMAKYAEDWPTAEKWYRLQLAEIRRLKRDSVEEIDVLADLANVYEQQGDAKQSAAFAAQAKALLDRAAARRPETVVSVSMTLGLREKRIGNLEGLKAFADRAYALWLTGRGVDSTDTMSVDILNSEVVDAYIAKADYAAAQSYLERGLVLAKQIFGADSSDTENVRKRLINNLTRQGKHDEAAKYRQ